ncbi:MAG: PAS domain S-box-containing protein [Arenicella sp.]|jgi:PAS domain S-box-containing protein
MGNERIPEALSGKSLRDSLMPILRGYLMSVCALCTILLAISLSRSLTTGWLPIYTVQIVLYCIALLFTFVPRLAPFRLIFLICFFMVLGTSGVLQFGFASVTEAAFVVAMVITTIGFGRLGLAIVSFLTVLIILTPHFAVMLEPIISTGLIPYRLPHTHYGLAISVLLFYGFSASYLVQRLVMTIHLKSRQLDISRTTTANVEHQIRQLMDNANIMIFGVDMQGKVNEWNKIAQKVTGFSRSEAMGLDFVNNFITEQYRPSVSKILQYGLKGVPSLNFEFPLFNKAGDRIDMLLNSSTQRDAAGQILGVFGLSRDITKLNEARNKQQRKDELAAELILSNKEKDRVRRAADKVKSEFISTISHELRTPLTSIKGALGLVLAGVLDKSPDKLRSIIEVAYSNSVRLNLLIDEILDIEKLDAGMMNLEMDATDLFTLIEEAVAANKGYAQQYGVTFFFSSIDKSLLVKADYNRLMQVIANLLSNAAKFSLHGGQVDVSLARYKGMVRISVADKGCGIEEQSQATIFDKFTQADSSDRRKQGGSGLGLSIAKKIVEAHNGDIHFTTEVDKGTTFYIDLPELQGSDNQTG